MGSEEGSKPRHPQQKDATRPQHEEIPYCFAEEMLDHPFSAERWWAEGVAALCGTAGSRQRSFSLEPNKGRDTGIVRAR